MTRSGRRWWLVCSLVVFAGGLIYGGRRLWRAWSYRTAVVEIQTQIHAGRHGAAARNLAALLDWEPGSDEAAYLLGVCEKARGRTAAADEAWARVPPRSRFAASAILGRASLLVDGGRFADAEGLLTRTADDPGIDGLGLRRFLASLYWHQGRQEEAKRSIEANWDRLNQEGRGGSDQAIELVRLYIALRVGSSSVESVRSFLDRAAALAPEDDRVWLGKANLAIRQGAFDEAARWLDACCARRPEDVPVWRARLDWAMAMGRVAEAREALRHLPVESTSRAQVHRLTAWFAARRGDVESERRALERLLVADPDDGLGPRPARRAGGPGKATGTRRRAARSEGRARSAEVSLQGVVPARATRAGCAGDGPPGRATGLPIRGRGLPGRGGPVGSRPPGPPGTSGQALASR